MKALLKVFPAAHLVISTFFVLAALGLLCFAGYELWKVVAPGEGVSVGERLGHVLDAIALLTIAVASLELGQTIVEEEVQREAHMSAPTRVRRFLSRFMVVLVVSLSIEALVAVFHFSRENPAQLPYAASIGLMAMPSTPRVRRSSSLRFWSAEPSWGISTSHSASLSRAPASTPFDAMVQKSSTPFVT